MNLNHLKQLRSLKRLFLRDALAGNQTVPDFNGWSHDLDTVVLDKEINDHQTLSSEEDIAGELCSPPTGDMDSEWKDDVAAESSFDGCYCSFWILLCCAVVIL